MEKLSNTRLFLRWKGISCRRQIFLPQLRKVLSTKLCLNDLTALFHSCNIECYLLLGEEEGPIFQYDRGPKHTLEKSGGLRAPGAPPTLTPMTRTMFVLDIDYFID